MGLKRKILKYIVIIAVVLLNSCDAPHSNPFDPNNKDKKLSTLDGIIKTVKIPSVPISDARIYWQNEEKITLTDENGSFVFEDIPKKNGFVYFEKEGFSPDSLFVSWNNSNSQTINGFLNSNPKLNDLTLYSIVLNNYPNQQNYSLEITAEISDDENDVDSVFVKNEYIESKKLLAYNPDTKIYKTEFLNFSKIEEVIGKEFTILVKDRNDKEFNVGASILKRIIKQELNFISPKNNENVSVKPELRWERFSPGFNFSYHLQIYTREIVPKLVWEVENVSSDSIAYTVDQSISSSINEYYWVIWAIDEFGNRTRSKPATFTVTSE